MVSLLSDKIKRESEWYLGHILLLFIKGHVFFARLENGKYHTLGHVGSV
jgi:hypothetical protein